MTDNNKSNTKPVQNRLISSLQACYQSYRQWQKHKGRQRKARKHLQERSNFYARFIKKGDLYFDVGANMGNRTEAFLKLGATVVAIEPQENCLLTLRERFCDNPSFILVDKALAETEGENEFFISNAHTLCSMSPTWIAHVRERNFFEGCTWDNKTVVPTTTLDTLIAAYGRPVFCKIDVEGSEYDVLRGLSQPINVISLEYTMGIIDPTINCIRYLSSLGNVRFNYSEGESMCLALSDWLKRDEIIDIIAKLPDNVLFGDVYAKFC